MRVISVPVYSYEELNQRARDRVRDFYLGSLDSDVFEEYCAEYLKKRFPCSRLRIEYSLNYCQGDGLNIYGELNLIDAFSLVRNGFSVAEQTEIAHLLVLYLGNYSMNRNPSRYAYCVCDGHEYTENLIDQMEENHQCPPFSLLRKFDRLVQNLMAYCCRELENAGYDFFHGAEDSDIVDWCEANNFEFYADGTLV